jgi:hypothetical protein
MTVNTFIYYDKADYFRNFMDSCFHLMKEKKIMDLILDLRGNDGGDPFCSSILFSYLQKSPVPYFAEPYSKYAVLADPIPIPQNNFSGNLYTLIDGSCGSTNGHFCALLKYHNIGKFVGTPSGSTYKCNAGKNTEFRLLNSKIIITIGRSTYSAAVDNMDKTAPIMPDIIVNENYNDFLDNKDLFIEKAIENVAICQNFSYDLYPHLYDSTPEISSPHIMHNNVEMILVVTESNQYGIVPVTMENGKPLLYSYKTGTFMGKDQQMSIGAGDFPDLAKTGFHSENQLDKKEMITGIPIRIINCTGRPNAYSISGFLADDEDIISV